jgi:hypothetical protein
MQELQLVPLALAKAVAEKDYKQLTAELPEGTFCFDTVVHLKGTIKKGAPFESKVPAAIDPWALLHRALSKLNAVTLESLVQEALNATEAETEEIKASAKKAVDRLVAATSRTMSGRVTAQVVWEVVS